MKLTGFTDEAAADLAGQIKVTKALGWDYLSARMIDGTNIHDLPEKDFELVCDQLAAANIKVAEFGTMIGSWAKTIDSDWSLTLAEIERCIPRMQRLGVKYARIMSYAQCKWGEDQHEQERFRRLREIVARFAGAGLEALHENCMNWGGFSPDHTLRLLDEIPSMRLVFDTGNPVFQRDRSKGEPYPWQDAFEFYQRVKHAIAHIHIKDGIMHQEEGEPEYTFAGEGQGHTRFILEDLIANDYTGFIAIEPHIGKVFHTKDQTPNPKREYALYLEYGQKFEQLLKELTPTPPMSHLADLKKLLLGRDTQKINTFVSDHPSTLDEIDENGISGLMYIGYHQLPESLAFAIDKKSSFTLHEAAAMGLLAKVITKVNTQPALLNTPAKDGFLPLTLACFFGQQPVVDYLLKKGAKVNVPATNPTKVMPLHSAVAKNDYAICELLINYGADVNARQTQGVTPLHSAAHRGNLKLVQLLVENGADISILTDEGESALSYAEKDEHKMVTDYLKGL